MHKIIKLFLKFGKIMQKKYAITLKIIKINYQINIYILVIDYLNFDCKIYFEIDFKLNILLLIKLYSF